MKDIQIYNKTLSNSVLNLDIFTEENAYEVKVKTIERYEPLNFCFLYGKFKISLVQVYDNHNQLIYQEDIRKFWLFYSIEDILYEVREIIEYIERG